MKFLTNIPNPTMPDAKERVFCGIGETQQEAWVAQKRWLSDKILGLPHKTDTYTVRELIKMSIVGVYLPDEKETDA